MSERRLQLRFVAPEHASPDDKMMEGQRYDIADAPMFVARFPPTASAAEIDALREQLRALADHGAVIVMPSDWKFEVLEIGTEPAP